MLERKSDACVFACLGLCIFFFGHDVWKRKLDYTMFAALYASVSRCTVMCAYTSTTYLHVPKTVLYCARMNVAAIALLSRCGTVIFLVPLFI